MAEIKEFVVNDRRKFTADGEVRPDAPPSVPKPPRPETLQPKDDTESSARLIEHVDNKPPQAVAPEGTPTTAAPDENAEPSQPPLTADQIAQAQRAYDATVDRLDTAIRATNPGMERIPEMNFERVIQSLYMQALMQLGGAAAPGQQPQLDIIGARQTIDMLSVLAEKTKGNLSPSESTLVETALFELHMGFLEVTQAIARQSAARQPGTPPPPGGPTIVR